MNSPRFRFATKLWLVLALALGLICLPAVTQEGSEPGTWDAPIQLYIVPWTGGETNWDALAQLQNDLTEITGLEFSVDYRSKEELAAELSSDREDAIALLSGPDYVDVHSMTQGTLVMSLATTNEFGLNYAYAAIYTLRDYGIESPEDMDGLTGACYDDGGWAWRAVQDVLLTEEFGYGDINLGGYIQVPYGDSMQVLAMLYSGEIDFFVDWGSPPVPTGVSDDEWEWGDDPERGIWDADCGCLVSAENRWLGTDIRFEVESQFPEIWEQVGIVDIAGPLGYSGFAFSSLFSTGLKVTVMEALRDYASTDAGAEVLNALGYSTLEGLSYIPDSYYDTVRIISGYSPLVFPYGEESDENIICKVGQARFRGSLCDCEDRAGVVIGFMPPWDPEAGAYPPVFYSLEDSTGGTPGYEEAADIAANNPDRGESWGGTQKYIPVTHDCDDFAHDLERLLQANGFDASFTVIAEKNPNYRPGNGQPYWSSGHAVADVHFADGTIGLFDGQSGQDVTDDYDCNKDGMITYFDGVYSTETTDCNFCICVYEDREAAEAAGETLD